MAIVIEEERNNKINIWTILMWALILCLVLFAVYYVFRRPSFIEVSVPEQLQTIRRISDERVQLNPDTIINDEKFKFRKPFVTPPVSGNLGRINPFVPL